MLGRIYEIVPNAIYLTFERVRQVRFFGTPDKPDFRAKLVYSNTQEVDLYREEAVVFLEYFNQLIKSGGLPTIHTVIKDAVYLALDDIRDIRTFGEQGKPGFRIKLVYMDKQETDLYTTDAENFLVYLKKLIASQKAIPIVSSEANEDSSKPAMQRSR